MTQRRHRLWRPGAPEGGRRPTNRAAVVAAILWKLRTGAGWRDIPTRFGVKWNTVYRYYRRHPDDYGKGLC